MPVKKREIDLDKERKEKARGDFRGPTDERLGKVAPDEILIGDDRQGGKIFSISTPIGAMLMRRQIDGPQYMALHRFHAHWYNAALGGGVRSVDLNRVYAPNPFDYLTASDRQWANRREYNRALDVLAFQERIIVQNLILSETMDVVQCGHGLGYRSPYRARMAGVKVVQGIADKWCNLWGIG